MHVYVSFASRFNLRLQAIENTRQATIEVDIALEKEQTQKKRLLQVARIKNPRRTAAAPATLESRMPYATCIKNQWCCV